MTPQKLSLLIIMEMIRRFGSDCAANQNNRQKPVIVKEYPDKDWQA